MLGVARIERLRRCTTACVCTPLPSLRCLMLGEGAVGRALRGQAVACPLLLSEGVAEAPRSRAAEGGREATRAARP